MIFQIFSKIFRKFSIFSWFSWFFMIFMIFSWFFMIFMIFSWKIKNFQKVQNFSQSIWKVPKMFCHLEIHWGALGRHNIFPEPPASFGFFPYVFSRSAWYAVEPQNPAQSYTHSLASFLPSSSCSSSFSTVHPPLS